jgi:UDP-sugar pyrophosphorylase
MVDNEGRFGLVPNKLEIETKPHGHGDVHTLLHMSGTAEKWLKEGKQWIIVFQDTNPFALRSFPLLLGISAEKDFDFNSLAVPRRPGEAVGAITTLIHKENNSVLTVNVEYNQLEGLFKESGGEPVDANGYSTYPGNINCFAIKLSTYVEVLARSQGLINEFINPKYADATKTKFKSSTRLECLMQDYPKLLHNCDKVGFSDVPRGYCFTTLKNDLVSATDKIKQGLSGEGAGSCESDIYFFNRQLLRMCGADIKEGDLHPVAGAHLPLFPMVSFSPAFATCLTVVIILVRNSTKR